MAERDWRADEKPYEALVIVRPTINRRLTYFVPHTIAYRKAGLACGLDSPPPALGYGHDNRNRYVVAAFAWPVLRIFSVPAAVMGRRRRERTGGRDVTLRGQRSLRPNL